MKKFEKDVDGMEVVLAVEGMVDGRMERGAKPPEGAL
jgi:hypothetical protein